MKNWINSGDARHREWVECGGKLSGRGHRDKSDLVMTSASTMRTITFIAMDLRLFYRPAGSAGASPILLK